MRVQPALSNVSKASETLPLLFLSTPKDCNSKVKSRFEVPRPSLRTGCISLYVFCIFIFYALPSLPSTLQQRSATYNHDVPKFGLWWQRVISGAQLDLTFPFSALHCTAKPSILTALCHLPLGQTLLTIAAEFSSVHWESGMQAVWALWLEMMAGRSQVVSDQPVTLKDC